MTDSIDKKSNEKRDNHDAELDALLDQAESSLVPDNAFDHDEDAIDRLLMNAGFEAADDALMQAVAKDVPVVEDVDEHDELDDFLSFEGFGTTLNELEQARAVETGKSAEAVVEAQEDEDDLDRLLMNTKLDETDALDELDDFSDFSNFNDPELELAAGREVEAVRSGEEGAAVLNDELDDFFGFNDRSDDVQDDEFEPSVSATPETVEQSGAEHVADAQDELDRFSDFSDFAEPETVPAAEVEGSEPAIGNADDDADDLSGFIADFDDADLLEDDEPDASVPAVADLTSMPLIDEDEQTGAVDEADDFSDFSDFAEPETVPAAEVEDSEPAIGNTADDDDLSDFIADFDETDLLQDEQPPQAIAEQPSDDQDGVDSKLWADEGVLEQTDQLGVSDDLDDFSALLDDFDEADLIQDDELEQPADSEQLTAAVEQPSDEELVADTMLSDDVLDAAEPLAQTDAISDELVDDFSGLGDDFDEADLLADDDASQLIGDESFNDLQDDENSFDSLFADAGFDADDALEQPVEKKEAFADDTDFSEIENFFQLDEVSDDFSKQLEEAQAEEAGSLLDQDDEFLLPDFDITADSDTSDAVIKTDELADVFNENDFMNESDAVQPSEPGIAELKTGDNEAIAEVDSKATDTTAQGIGDVQLSPFGFEHEDLKSQLEAAEKKLKKTKLFGYAALGFGVVALGAAAGLGVMTYSAKTEVSKLTETVSTLETNLAKSAANSPSEEINSMRNSVGQLNQKVDGFITELKGKPEFPVDWLNNKVPDIAEKQDMVSKALDMLQVKIGGMEEKALPTPPVVEAPKVEAAHEPTKESAEHEQAPSNEPAAHEPVAPKEGNAHEPPKKGAEPVHAPTVKEAVAVEPASAKQAATPVPTSAKEAVVQEQAPTNDRAKHEKTPAKVEAVPEIAPVKAKVQPEAVAVKPVTPETAVAKAKPVEAPKQAAPGKWGVNLGAFKQEWFAQSKAAEYARQGIYAEVIPVPGKNSMMYRLRVGGFKNKAAASSNTARIKQTLNLDSVWVSDN